MPTQNQELDSHVEVGSLLAKAVGQPQLLVDILNTITDRVFLKDSTGRLTFVNQAFLKTYGYTTAEVLGKQCEEILPAEMANACNQADQAVLDSGEPLCLVTHWQEGDEDNHHWSETHKSPLRNQLGQIIGIVGVSRDVTARRNAEEELKRQKALLELIIETVPDEIFVKDCNRNIILANQAFYRDSDLCPKDTLGQDPTEKLPKDLRQVSRDSDDLVLRQGQTICQEVSLINHDGREQIKEVRKLPLREDDKIMGIVSVCRNLTEAKRNEQRAKRNEALLLHASRLSTIGELAAGIAHEVNQPLFSILNYAKAVENTLESEEDLDLDALRRWVRQIRNEASRGGKITQRLKSFVKPADAQREQSDLNLIVLESVEFMTKEAHDAGITIEVETCENLPTLLVDRIQIQQVLVNLLKNAIEALIEQSTSQPRLAISTNLLDGRVEVLVADNGPGVQANDSINILETFQTTKHDGLGLGLAISNTIVETHKGRLDYFPNDWGGVTFSMTLPIMS